MGDDVSTVLKINIEASLKDFSAKMDEFEKVLKGTGEEAKKTGESFKNIFAGVFTAEAALKILEKAKAITMSLVKDYDQEVIVLANLKRQLGDTTEIEQFAIEQSKLTRSSKDAYMASASILATHKLNKEQILQLLPRIADLASSKPGGMANLAEVAHAAGYAIEYGTAKGLKPYGIELDKVMSQQEIHNYLVGEGTEKYKGSAEVMAKLGAGPLVVLQNQMKEIGSQIGEKLLPVVIELTTGFNDKVLPVIVAFTDNLDRLLPSIKFVGEGLLLYFSATKLASIAESVGLLTTGVNGLALSMSGMITGIAAAATANPIGAGIVTAFLTYQVLKKGFDVTGLGKFLEEQGMKIGQAVRDAQNTYKKYQAGFAPLPEEEPEAEGPMTFEPVNVKGGTTSALSTKKGGKGAKEALIGPVIPPVILAQRRYQMKEEEKLRKKAEERGLNDTEEASDESLRILQEELDAKKAMIGEYGGLGQSLGEAFASGITKSQGSLKEALKGVLMVMLSFIEQKVTLAIFEHAVDRFAKLGPIGLVIAGAEAGLVMGLFEGIKSQAAKFASGGMIEGPGHSGGGVMINAEGGEYVHSRYAVDRYGTRSLDAINRGMVSPAALRSVTSGGGASGSGAFSRSAKGTTIVNFVDPSAFKRFLSTPEGKNAISNHINENSFSIKQSLGVA